MKGFRYLFLLKKHDDNSEKFMEEVKTKRFETDWEVVVVDCFFI